MTELERVIYDIERCICNVPDACRDCSKYQGGMYIPTCEDQLLNDALRLLKEQQEPRTPHYTRLQYSINGIVHEIKHPECPRCFENGLDLWAAEIERGQAYCKRCGQKVVWDND